MSRLHRVGIIGMGYNGRAHYAALHHIPDAEVAAVRYFLDCVRSRQKPLLCPAEDSLQVMRVMDGQPPLGGER